MSSRYHPSRIMTQRTLASVAAEGLTMPSSMYRFTLKRGLLASVGAVQSMAQWSGLEERKKPDVSIQKGTAKLDYEGIVDRVRVKVELSIRNRADEQTTVLILGSMSGFGAAKDDAV